MKCTLHYGMKNVHNNLKKVEYCSIFHALEKKDEKNTNFRYIILNLDEFLLMQEAIMTSENLISMN